MQSKACNSRVLLCPTSAERGFSFSCFGYAGRAEIQRSCTQPVSGQACHLASSLAFESSCLFAALSEKPKQHHYKKRDAWRAASAADVEQALNASEAMHTFRLLPVRPPNALAQEALSGPVASTLHFGCLGVPLPASLMMCCAHPRPHRLKNCFRRVPRRATRAPLSPVCAIMQPKLVHDLGSGSGSTGESARSCACCSRRAGICWASRATAQVSTLSQPCRPQSAR